MKLFFALEDELPADAGFALWSGAHFAALPAVSPRERAGEGGAAPRCFALLLALAAVVYGFDRIVGANYMFLLAPAPGSPLEWFAGFLGNPGYLLGYLPMLAAVWAALYLPGRKLKTAPS